jgi:fluoride exporter
MRPAIDPRELAAIFAGGFAGAIARVALGEAIVADPSHWPWATFAVNVAGALVLGYFGARFERVPMPSYRLRLVGTGFCGALTTFATVQLELLHMLDGAHYALAAGYALASIAAGVAAVAVATSMGRRGRVAT